MRHAQVTRFSFGMLALALAAALGFAWRASRPGADASGASAPTPGAASRAAEPAASASSAAALSAQAQALFAAQCADCHTPEELVDGLRAAPALEAAAAAMRARLAEHGEGSDEQDRLLVEWLLALARRAPAEAAR